jgi:hypothetical protein
MKKRIKKFSICSDRRREGNKHAKKDRMLLFLAAVSIKFEITCSEKQLLVQRTRGKFISSAFERINLELKAGGFTTYNNPQAPKQVFLCFDG